MTLELETVPEVQLTAEAIIYLNQRTSRHARHLISHDAQKFPNALDPAATTLSQIEEADITLLDENNYVVINEASDNDRDSYWRNLGLTNYEQQKRKWLTDTASYFNNNAAYFDTDAGKREVMLYKRLGINIGTAISENDIERIIYNSLFTGGTKHSNTLAFVRKILPAYKKIGGYDLNKIIEDKDILVRIGTIFGNDLASEMVEALIAEARAENNKKELIEKANRDDRINQLSDIEKLGMEKLQRHRQVDVSVPIQVTINPTPITREEDSEPDVDAQVIHTSEEERKIAAWVKRISEEEDGIDILDALGNRFNWTPEIRLEMVRRIIAALERERRSIDRSYLSRTTFTLPPEIQNTKWFREIDKQTVGKNKKEREEYRVVNTYYFTALRNAILSLGSNPPSETDIERDASRAIRISEEGYKIAVPKREDFLWRNLQGGVTAKEALEELHRFAPHLTSYKITSVSKMLEEIEKGSSAIIPIGSENVGTIPAKSRVFRENGELAIHVVDAGSGEIKTVRIEDLINSMMTITEGLDDPNHSPAILISIPNAKAVIKKSDPEPRPKSFSPRQKHQRSRNIY